MIAQAPALFESLTGQKVSDLMSRVPALADLVPPPENGERRPGQRCTARRAAARGLAARPSRGSADLRRI